MTRDQAASALETRVRVFGGPERIDVPTRRVDVNDAVVLIEDVARVIGYDAITGAPSAETPTAGATTALDAARQTARGLLAGNGFLELRGVPLEPLEGEANFSQLKGDSITLTNPLNADLARLRRSLVPFLLKTTEHNAKRRSTTFRYFEIDKVFSRPVAEPEEYWALGILLGGALNDWDWSTRRDVDLFDLKGIVESILETLRAPRVLHTGFASRLRRGNRRSDHREGSVRGINRTDLARTSGASKNSGGGVCGGAVFGGARAGGAFLRGHSSRCRDSPPCSAISPSS